MVTYLACFIVCDFEHAEKLTAVHNTRFRVFATPEAKAKDRIQYALDIGANITDYFENYFEVVFKNCSACVCGYETASPYQFSGFFFRLPILCQSRT